MNHDLREEMKERMKRKTHDFHLTLIFSAMENIVILFPHISSDPRMAPKKFMQDQLIDPQMYFDRVMSFDMTTFEYKCNGEQISDDLVGVSNTFLSYLQEMKAKDASFTYIELYHNGERVTSISHKRSLFNRATKLLQKSANGETLDLFKKEGNVIYARDIIEYLGENVVRPTQEPARYREQLKKMWEQLVTSSLVHIQTEKGIRVVNGICIRMEDTTDTKMEVQLFLYLETPDIVMLPEQMLNELNSCIDLSLSHPDMTTLVCSTSNDYEFGNLILNGLFNIPIWKCYAKVMHQWTYEEGIPHRTDGFSIVRENLFADSGLQGMELTNKWDTIENKFIQYHLYLFMCLENGRSDIMKYTDYTSFIRNDGTPPEKIIDTTVEDQTSSDVMRTTQEEVFNQSFQLGSTTNPKLDDTTPIMFTPNEDKVVTSPHANLHDAFAEYTKFLPSISQEAFGKISDAEKYQCYADAATGLRKLEKIHCLLIALAKMGMSESFYDDVYILNAMNESQIDAIAEMLRLMQKHSTRSDVMMQVLKTLAK